MNLHSLRKKQAKGFAKMAGGRFDTVKNLTADEFKELMKKAKQK